MSCLFLIAFAAAIYLVELLSLSMAFGMWPGADMILWMFQDPCTLLMLSLLILCLRLCWLKLRKVDRVESTIIAIDSRLFLWCWIAVAAIVCVGIPAVSAFVFVFWLGPWYLYGQ
jgi:hypothetical protein